jgi:hypothetical protein
MPRLTHTVTRKVSTMNTLVYVVELNRVSTRYKHERQVRLNLGFKERKGIYK